MERALESSLPALFSVIFLYIHQFCKTLLKSLVNNMPGATSVAKEIIPDSKLALLAVSKQNVTHRYSLKMGAEGVPAMSQHPEVALKWGMRDTHVFYRK